MTQINEGGPARVSSVTYRPHGGISQWTAGNSVVTTIAADPSFRARPQSITSSRLATRAYTYDSAGNIKSMGSDLFKYDSRSRLVYSKVFHNSIPYELKYLYDQYGNLNPTGANPINPANNRLSLGIYDAGGNLTSYGSQRYDYDGLSRQTALNGGYERYLYDGAGERVARVTAPGTGAKLFTISPCRVLDTRFSPPAVQAERAVQVTGTCGIPSGASGLVGNLVALPGGAGGFLNIYPTGTNPATSTLNFNPGLVRANNFQLSLSGNGQMTLVASTPVDAIVDVVGYFAFDNPTWTMTFRDEANRLASEYTVAALVTRTRNYFYFGNLLVATRDSGGNYLYYASDHLGTPRQVTNSLGQVTETHKYQPFGTEIGGSFGTQPLKFASMERDVSSGNDFDHARYQSSLLGRFLSPEPLFLGAPVAPQSWNAYSYAGNNPLKFVDPDGNILLPIVVVTGAVGGFFWGGADLRAFDRENPGASLSMRLAKYSVGFLAGFAGAVAGGLQVLRGNPGLAGATSGALASVTDQFLNNLLFSEDVSAGQFALDVVSSAAIAKIGYRAAVHPGADPLLSKFRPLGDYIRRPKVARLGLRSVFEGALGAPIGQVRLHGDTSQGFVPFVSPNYLNFQYFIFQYTTEVAASQGIPGGSVSVSASISLCRVGQPCPH